MPAQMLDGQPQNAPRNAPPAQPAPAQTRLILKTPVPQPPAPKPAAQSPALLGAPPAQPRRRHWLIAVSFLLAVILPTLMAATYLTWTAADRYGSRLAFSIRSNQTEIGRAHV